MAELPAFQTIKDFESGNYERFYMTEQHQECADWRLRVEDYDGTVAVLQAHSQYLAGASPVFAGMVAEKISCDSPIDIGSFRCLKPALAVLRLVYRSDAVTAESVRELMRKNIFIDVMRLGDKFNFFFYESFLKICTPKFLTTVPHYLVISAATLASIHELSQLECVFKVAITDILIELQQLGDGKQIDEVVSSLSKTPALMQAALGDSLKALSLSGPRAMYSFCGKKKDKVDAWESIDAEQAFFTFSFCRRKGRDGIWPTSLHSPTFDFEGHAFRVTVELDSTVEERQGKFVGVYLEMECAQKTEEITLRAKLRVVNLCKTESSWTCTLTPSTFSKASNAWGFSDIAPMTKALLATANGPMCCVQVVSMEKVEKKDEEPSENAE